MQVCTEARALTVSPEVALLCPPHLVGIASKSSLVPALVLGRLAYPATFAHLHCVPPVGIPCGLLHGSELPMAYTCQSLGPRNQQTGPRDQQLARAPKIQTLPMSSCLHPPIHPPPPTHPRPLPLPHSPPLQLALSAFGTQGAWNCSTICTHRSATASRLLLFV